MKQFRDIGISEPIIKIIEAEKFLKPSEVQKKTVPLILKGRDVIASSATGSGKTFAFAAGIIKKFKKINSVQSLTVVPTRELAKQVAKVFNKYAKHKNLQVLSIYGGVSIKPQIKKLKTADIVVGTPGRLLDHLQRRTIDLSNIKYLILDEADRMLDMGFIDDVSKIIKHCPKKRQTLLFSATISNEVITLADKYMNNPIEIEAEKRVDPEKISQIYYDVDDKKKFSLLVHLLKKESSNLVMVFCNTRKTTEFIAKNLKNLNINAAEIHGGLSQGKRHKVLSDFHNKKTTVLVCTDVAARGLDVKGVSHVYNYSIPRDAKDYIHRIGRTARAGNEGKVINLIGSKDYSSFDKVNRKNDNIKHVETPNFKSSRITWVHKKRKRRFNKKRFKNKRKRKKRFR